jgi:hypothetical protein
MFWSSVGRYNLRSVPNRKQNFAHPLFSVLSAIINIAKPPSRHLEKSHNNNNTQPKSTPSDRLLEYCLDSWYLAAHRATTSSSRATFKFRLFCVPPRTLDVPAANCHDKGFSVFFPPPKQIFAYRKLRLTHSLSCPLFALHNPSACHTSAAGRLLRLWVRIPPWAWMSLCCECCVLSGRSLCDELITHREDPYRVWCAVVCDLETSWMRKPWSTGGAVAPPKN